MTMTIGLEIGARSVKAAWAIRRRGALTWHYAEHLRSQEADAEALAGDLAQLLRPVARYQHSASLILAAPNSGLRQLTVQVPDARAVPAAVREALPTALPFEAERAHVRFLIERQQPVDGRLECVLSLSACERFSLEQHLTALWQAGWVASSVVPAAIALIKTATALQLIDQEPVVLVEIGQRQTTIVLVEAGKTVYARDVALGDDHLTDALMGQVSLGQRTLSLSAEEARALKQRVGIPEAQSNAAIEPHQIPASTYLAMLQPILEQLVTEIRRTMTFGAYTATTTAPQQVVISGEGSRLPNVSHWLSGQLGVPVVRLNCEKLAGEAAAASAVACGLALHERLPKPDLQSPAWRRRGALVRGLARSGMVLLVLALLIWIGAGWWGYQHRDVRQALGKLDTRWAGIEPMVVLQETVAAHVQLVEGVVDAQSVPLRWFRELAGTVPSAVRLSQLSVNAVGGARLAGEAQERDQSPEGYVSEFTLSLEQSGVCRKVQLGSGRRAGPSEEQVEFEVSCEVVK